MNKIANDTVLIGRGRLTWDPMERRSDRYGYVFLMGSGDSLSTGLVDMALIVVRSEHIGLRAKLTALVLETRDSTHVGDLFHGVFPSTPKVGDVITLGTGLLQFGYTGDPKREYGPRVGLQPFDDDRATMWLDIHALYRCHEQTVELRYEPLESE